MTKVKSIYICKKCIKDDRCELMFDEKNMGIKKPTFCPFGFKSDWKQVK